MISSVYAFGNGFGATPYAMSKAGVEQFGRALRVELVQHGTSASVAYFGFIDTEDGPPRARPGSARRLDARLVPEAARKRLQPTVAGEAIVSGIERRAPRIVRPRRWVVMSALRGSSIH